MDKAIVIGVGPQAGLGARLAARFASLGLHTFVAGRTPEQLDRVVKSIETNDGRATAVVTDATSESGVIELDSDRVDAAGGGEIDIAIYNAGNNTPGRIVEMTADYFEHSWRVGCFGGFLFGREAVRRMLPQGRGTLLFTGASASLRGRANFGAFNSAKGALRNLAQAMAKEYGPQRIHVGHVVIDGPIGGDKIIKGLPEYANKLGEEGLINLEGIVDAFQYLYKQPRTAWSFEVDVRTSQERW
ncbi:MAG: SDR family NAD(P)-dependent oxidoreductase [Gammaproteobacteria bacterium]|nr:SDR family NAD(P)-dependent oxidoreductase [Gammaproteobacteria bacterium]